MKKFVVLVIIIVFVILFGILFFKAYKSNKYSSENLYSLVQMGIENMHDMQNVCIERENEYGVVKFFYKGNKVKGLYDGTLDSTLSYSITDLDEGKRYMVLDEKKLIIIQKENSIDKGLQYLVFNYLNNLNVELSYIKDEKIEGKDCIFVKEITYYKADDGSFQTDSESNEEISAYWIEKLTGFVLGYTTIKPTQTSAIPKVWIKNITFSEVVDSDFNLPTDYTIYNNTK